MLFNIDKKGNVLDDNGFISSIPEFDELFETLGNKYFKWIVFVYDYESPYRNLPIEQRKAEVSKDIFNNVRYIKEEENPVFVKAVNKYKFLMFDPIVEQYSIQMEKLNQLNKFISNWKVETAELEDIKKIQDIIIKNETLSDIAIKLRQKIAESKSTAKGRLLGGGNLTFLEANINSIQEAIDKR